MTAAAVVVHVNLMDLVGLGLIVLILLGVAVAAIVREAQVKARKLKRRPPKPPPL